MVTTIGAKEGLSHLMWVLVGPGDTALVPVAVVPDPHLRPALRRRRCPPRPPRRARWAETAGSPGEAFFDNLMEAWESAWPKPRVVVLSFPHNPTTECVDLAWMTRLVEFAREHEIVLVHDFAYADIAFDGYTPPSILQVPGAKDVAVELYTLTKSFSMAGWRVGFLVGNAAIVQALTKLKSYLDYGTFQPIQIAAIVAMNEAPDYPKVINETYQARRDALCDGLNRIGWEITPPRGTMFVWAPDPRAVPGDGLARVLQVPGEARPTWPPRPASGFGPGRRRPRALRPHRERAAHRPGRPQPAQGPHPAALTRRAAPTARPPARPAASAGAVGGSGQSGPADLHPGLLDPARPGRARPPTRCWSARSSCRACAGPCPRACRRSRSGRWCTRLDDLAPLGHQQALGGDGVGHPHPAVGVETDPVGRAPRERRPTPGGR